MVGWHHGLNGHEFEQTLGDSEGQGSLACCSPWGHKELDMTQQLNNSNKNTYFSTGKYSHYNNFKWSKCLAFCGPMDCNTPGFPILHCLLEFAHTHVH